jgi:hypothetical protein
MLAVLDLRAVSAATRLLSAAKAAVDARFPSAALAEGAGVAPVAEAAKRHASPMSFL